jgi:hypothetical protein
VHVSVRGATMRVTLLDSLPVTPLCRPAPRTDDRKAVASDVSAPARPPCRAFDVHGCNRPALPVKRTEFVEADAGERKLSTQSDSFKSSILPRRQSSTALMPPLSLHTSLISTCSLAHSRSRSLPPLSANHTAGGRQSRSPDHPQILRIRCRCSCHSAWSLYAFCGTSSTCLVGDFAA